MLYLLLLLSALAGSVGCGQQGLNMTPLTEEEKQKIKEDDRRVQDAESKQDRDKPKAKAKSTRGRSGEVWEP
jgi:hypothetical protein